MGKENNTNKTWKGKLLDQYRMIIVNEKTFEEQFYFRLSRLNVIVLLILLISSIMTGTFFLITSTPVKEFIPGYPSSELRLKAIKNTFLLDSIMVTKILIGVLALCSGLESFFGFCVGCFVFNYLRKRCQNKVPKTSADK